MKDEIVEWMRQSCRNMSEIYWSLLYIFERSLRYPADSRARSTEMR